MIDLLALATSSDFWIDFTGSSCLKIAGLRYCQLLSVSTATLGSRVTASTYKQSAFLRMSSSPYYIPL